MTNPVPDRPPSPFDREPRAVAAVFRSPVFNPSETFVRAQSVGLVRYQPLIVGLERIGNIPPALSDRVLLPRNARERLAIRLFGHWGRMTDRVGAIRPVLVHAHFGPDGVLALPLAKALGLPLVTTLRGYDVSRSTLSLLRSGRLSWARYVLGRRKLMLQGQLFLAVSEALRRQAIMQGYPADRILTHYNGVDLAAFPFSRDDDGETLLHVGRLVEKKGTALLLHVFASLAARFPRSRLVIIGDGPLRASLERLAGALALGDSVRFLGRLPSERVAEWMRRAAILAVPSLVARDGDSEGLPNVVVEAAASGRPVVASHHRGIPEAVRDGRTGFLVAEGEAEPLARRLAELLADGGMRRRMGTAARSLVEQKFDAAGQMRLLEARYDALLAEWRTARSTIETR